MEAPAGLGPAGVHGHVSRKGAATTFDLGAFTVHRDGVLLVSDQAHRTTGFSEVLMCHHGRPIRDPQRREWGPAPVSLEWHTREVFKGSARERL
jgi:putative restriction endonuclease